MEARRRESSISRACPSKSAGSRCWRLLRTQSRDHGSGPLRRDLVSASSQRCLDAIPAVGGADVVASLAADRFGDRLRAVKEVEHRAVLVGVAVPEPPSGPARLADEYRRGRVCQRRASMAPCLELRERQALVRRGQDDDGRPA